MLSSRLAQVVLLWAHILLLSILTWNLKMGAFNMVSLPPVGIPQSTPAPPPYADPRAHQTAWENHKIMNKGIVALWNPHWRLMKIPLLLQNLPPEVTTVIQHFIDPEKKITVSQQDGCLTRSPEQWLTILSKLNLSRQHVISLWFWLISTKLFSQTQKNHVTYKP